VTIVANPNTPVVDAAAGAIHADWYPILLTASDVFPATGRNEELTYARGKVVFTSKNTITDVVIREGTRVSTVDGREYRTLALAILPEWSSDGTKPTFDVQVQAVRRGKDGNAGKDAVSVMPKGLSKLGISVTNPDPIEGGDKVVTNVVNKKDCEDAQATLLGELAVQLQVKASEPATPGLTRYPTSASLGSPVLTPTCAELMDQKGPTFDVAATTTGTVLEVDVSLLEPTAEEHFGSIQDPTVRIEPGSIVATRAGEPVITTDAVSYPMEVTARVTRDWDAATIRNQIAGKPISEANDILRIYGEHALVMWPDFVPNVPTDVNRIAFIVQ